MPQNISRRRFMRDASVGAAAVGAGVVGGAALRSPGSVATSSPGLGSPAEAVDGGGVIAHVVDARRGEISILVGTREVRYTNREMAQQLMRAAQ